LGFSQGVTRFYKNGRELEREHLDTSQYRKEIHKAKRMSKNIIKII
jgi:hypothetical protein